MKMFAQHYFEMVAAMFSGMVAFQLSRRAWAYLGLAGGGVIGTPLGAVSTGDLWSDVGTIATMDIAMVIPMVLWMRHRAHSWRHSVEMSVAMIAPTIPFHVAGFIWPDLPMINLWAHVAMLLGMLAIMIARRDMYMGHGHATHDHVPDARVTVAH
jgi:hypothetical protein